MESNSVCINCSAPIPSSGPRRLGYVFLRTTKLSIREALCVLYQRPKHFLDSEQTEIVCCEMCTSIIEEMYKLFAEFEILQNDTSRLRTVIPENLCLLNGKTSNKLTETSATKTEFKVDGPENGIPFCSAPENSDGSFLLNYSDSVAEEVVVGKHNAEIQDTITEKQPFKLRLTVLENKTKRNSQPRNGKVTRKSARLKKNTVFQNDVSPPENVVVSRKKLQSIHKPERSVSKRSRTVTEDTSSLQYSCQICKKSLETQAGLDSHIAQVHFSKNEKPYKCDICEKTFITPFTLKEHRRSHIKKKPKQCPHCEFACSRNIDLKSHIGRIHQEFVDTPRLKCPSCPKTYVTPAELRRHDINKHRPEDKNVVCDVCGRKYADLKSCNVHKSRIHGRKKGGRKRKNKL